MTIATLNYINKLMRSMDIHYRFMHWKEKPPDDYYFTGEYFENPSLTKEENGRHDTTFILRGYTRDSWLLLEQTKERIEKNCGKTVILNDGTGIAIFYDSATIVPTGDNSMKSIKINLTIQEWKVN